MKYDTTQKSHQLLVQNIEVIKKYIHVINIKKNYNLTDEEKEDIFQDICVKLLESGIKNFRGRCKFSSYVYKIVSNEICSFVQKNNKIKNLTNCDYCEYNNEEEKYNKSSNILNKQKDILQDAFIKNDIQDIIKETVKSFTPKMQLIYKWYFVDGETQAEVAKMCKCSQPTIAEYIEKIRRAIKSSLEKKYPDLDISELL